MRAYLLFLVSLLRDCGSKRTASIPTPPAVPMIPNRSVNVVAYGAVPNDGKDDTQAIQNAIDDLQSKGGGSVMFPAGRYDISIQPTSTICSPSNTSANCRPHPLALVLYSKLRLASADATNRATLRLADNQGNYEAIMATAEYWFPLEDFVLENVIIDANGPNNPVRRPAGSDACCENSPDFGIGYNQTQRYALRVYIGARLLVDNVRFLASVNTNVVTFNGEDVTDGEIKNSRFESVGQDLVDFDHSSIYTSGKRFRIIDNTFTSKNGPGTLGARTAIEIHGDDQLVKNNEISGFTFGVNVVGDTASGSERQVYINNTIEGAVTGFVLWAFHDNGSTEKTLKDTHIRQNKVTLNGDAWLNANLTFDATFVAGILLEASSLSPIADLVITDNTFTISNATGFRSNYEETRSGGIVLDRYQQPELGIDHLIIENNLIENSLGPGIFITVPIGSTTKRSRIVKNTIVDPVRGKELRYEEAKQTRAGIYLAKESDGSVVTIPVRAKNLRIARNKIQGNPSKLVNGIAVLSRCARNCVVKRNSVTPSSVPLYNLGQNWIQ
jgi:Pectate lyase superfamily protein